MKHSKAATPVPAHPVPAHPVPAHPVPAHPVPAHPVPAHLVTPLVTLAVTLLVTLLACADAAGQDRRRRGGWRERVELKHLVAKADQGFASKAVDKATYSIYLPKDYDGKDNDRRYPVIYFLHGLFEDHNRFGFRGGAKALDDAIGAKILPEVVFVCAYDGSGRSFYVDNERTGEVEKMIVGELIPHIDSTYRTLARRDQRVLLGVSMGGFGAIKIALKHPKVFGVLATHSAAILPERSADLPEMFPWTRQVQLATAIFGDPVDEDRWRAENPLVLAGTIPAEKLAGLAIYFDCGDKDRYGLDQTNTMFHELLDQRKIPHQWRLVKGGGHGWNTRSSEVGYNNANLPTSLRFIGDALARKPAGENGASKPPPRKPGGER